MTGSDTHLTLQDEAIGAVIASAPSTITIIVGFFIFHYLASRRQTRDEIHQSILNTRQLVDELLEVAEKAWKEDGKTASESGSVQAVRRAVTAINIEVDYLCRQSSNFDESKKLLRALKASVDEANITKNKILTHIDLQDISRLGLPSLPIASRGLADRFVRSVKVAFADRYS